MWIDIEDTNGLILGDGPITSASGWRQTARLNRAGEFSFRMAAGDARRALVQQRRVMRAWQFDPWRGLNVEVGAGVVERIRTVVDGGRVLVEVSGRDELLLLADRTVGDLALMDQNDLTPTAVAQVDPGSTDLPNAYDADPLTVANVTLTGSGTTPADWIYVESAATFDAVLWTLGANVNTVATTLHGQFYNGESAGWEAIEITADGTAVAGAPLAQSGRTTFVMPKGWGLLGTAYIVRFWVEATLDDVDLAEIAVRVTEPTDTALATLLALAPSGWAWDTVDGYSSTGTGVYLMLAGQSLLAALALVAEQLGHNFRRGAGKQVVWLRDDQRLSGLRAVGHVDPVAVESNTDVVVLTGLRAAPDEDGADLVTRVYPFGGGIGAMRPTLALTTRTAPTGYTLSKTSNYLSCDAAETAYGRIEATMTQSDVVAADTSDTQRACAADALFDAAYEYLRRRVEPLKVYECEVVRAAREIQPGELLRVVYEEWVDGAPAVAVDAELWVLETTTLVDESGVRVTGLTLATADRWPQSATGLVVGAIQQGQQLAAVTPPQIGRNSAAQGVPTYLVVEDGLVTAVTRQVGVSGTFDTGVGPLGNMGTITFVEGIFTAVTEAT